MTRGSVIWKGRFRSRLAWAVGRSWPFLRDTLAFGLTLGLGWEASWLSFGRYLDLAVFPIFCIPAGVVFAGAFRLRTRGRIDRKTRRALGLTFAGIFGTMLALHFVRQPLKRFEFLDGHPAAFSLEPTFPTYTEAAYSFQADLRSVISRARPELRRHGYEIRDSGDRLDADKGTPYELPGSTWPVPDSVSISMGKAVGKRFVVDGDMLTIQPRPDWVTVSVAQPEPRPFWIRLFVP